MAKSNSGKKSEPPGAAGGDEDQVTVKIYRSERDLVNKVAGSRGQTTAELFRSPEVKTFLLHLMRAATESEVKRHEGEERR
jgi:hypothetical protein